MTRVFTVTAHQIKPWLCIASLAWKSTNECALEMRIDAHTVVNIQAIHANGWPNCASIRFANLEGAGEGALVPRLLSIFRSHFRAMLQLRSFSAERKRSVRVGNWKQCDSVQITVRFIGTGCVSAN